MVRKGLNEQDILQQIIHGNPGAMKEFYNTYSGYLTVVCSRYIPNREDLKDVLQESFIKIFKAVHQFEYKGEGSLKAWTTRIVVNEALKYLKESQKMNITNLTDWDLPEIADEQEPDFDEIPTSVILEMIRSLPTGYRTVFNLYVLEEKSHKEIASILGIAENSSASQLHRAKRLLVKEIELYRTKKSRNERSMAK